MEIDKDLYKEIKAYCDLNGLKARDFIHKLLKDAFIKEKYGDRPFASVKNEVKKESKTVEKPKQEQEIVHVPFTLVEEAIETIGTCKNTSASTVIYEEKEVPNEYFEEIKVEQPAVKPRKRKLS